MSDIQKIKIYSTPTCPYCTMAKEFFKEQKLEFEEVDVSQNQEQAEKMVTKTGQMGVPVIEIIIGTKEEYIVGFDREKLLEKLKNEK